MRVLPRLVAAAAALLLLASPLSATLPEGTSWTLTGVTRIVSSSGGATRVQKGLDTAHLTLPGAGDFSLYLESESSMVYEGTLVEDGRRTLLAVDQASQDAYIAGIVDGLSAMGISVVESTPPVWAMNARVLQRSTGEVMRMAVSIRWRLTTEYAGRTKRIGLRVGGIYKGTQDV